MDFQNAALLVLAVYGITEFAKALIGEPWNQNSRVVVLLALVVGQAAVWLVGTTAWAHEQVIGAKPLDELNTGSKVLVGLFAAGVAAFGDKFLSTLRNVGQNQPTDVQREALDAGAERLVAAQTPTAGGSPDHDDITFQE